MTNHINSYEALLERVWANEDFKNGFIADPKPILAKIGAKVPDSVTAELHEASANFVCVATTSSRLG